MPLGQRRLHDSVIIVVQAERVSQLVGNHRQQIHVVSAGSIQLLVPAVSGRIHIDPNRT